MPKTTLRELRDEYLAQNEFTMDAYSSPTFEMPLFGREWSFPNPPTRQRVIARHDLHHALTGYGTDYVGEGEIGVWELRAGCNSVFLWFINGVAAMIGMALSPARMLRAFRAAKGARSLYLDTRSYQELLAMDVETLRAECGVPREGVVPKSASMAPALQAS